jgi:hypothetical protein
MWRIRWAPNSIPIYIQQDAKLHSLFISGNGWLRKFEIPNTAIYELRHSTTDVVKQENLTSDILKMAARNFFETSVNIYQS